MTTKLSQIILIRHGESETNKENSHRHLTMAGKQQVTIQAEKLNKLIRLSKSVIVTTDTNRTKETANILAKKLKINEIALRDLEISGFSKFAKSAKSPVRDYFKLLKGVGFSKIVDTPVKCLSQFENILNKFKDTADILILVGHGGILDSIINFHPLFDSNAKMKLPLKYADFIQQKFDNKPQSKLNASIIK